jgi:hypothetical protein
VNVAGSALNGCVEAVFGITSPIWLQNNCTHKSFCVNTYSDLCPPETPIRRASSPACASEGGGLMTALSSTRRADAPLGEVLTSPTDLPIVGEVPPCLRPAFVADEITEPAVGTLALDGAFKLLTQV